MDYSKLVEALKKQEANRKCFDCGVVGTTYASLNFGTFVCSQCAGILRGLNYKVKPLGISIFTINEYEILQKNGNEKAKNIWMGLYDPYKHEKPNPKSYNEVKNHLIRKYKEKKFYRESKGIQFINKSIEEDIKDPLELNNKCKIKNINIGPMWTHKKIEKKDIGGNNDNNRDNFNENKNINTNKNIDLLGGLLEVGGNENNNDNKKIDDVNDLFNGLNFNNENKVIKLNNMINNLNNNNNINQKDENDFNFGFDFSTFNKNNNNSQINIQNQNKEEIKDENLGFDFGVEKSDNSNNKDINSDDKLEGKKETGINLLDFDFSNNNNNQKENDIMKNNNIDNDYIKKEENILELNLGNNEQCQNISDKNFGFDFNSNKIVNKQEEKEVNDVTKENIGANKNNNIIDLGVNFDTKNAENKEEINNPTNINSIFEDPNTEKINDMKNNQEIKRNENFQNLTNALENQNQIDKINQGNVDAFLINNIIQNSTNNENKEKNNNGFNFDKFMNLAK